MMCVKALRIQGKTLGTQGTAVPPSPPPVLRWTLCPANWAYTPQPRVGKESGMGPSEFTRGHQGPCLLPPPKHMHTHPCVHTHTHLLSGWYCLA